MSTELSIEEGNKLIAQFLGWEFKLNGSAEIVGIFEGFTRWILSNKEFDDLLLKGFVFHSEWDKLMPVVERISKIELDCRYDEDFEKWVRWTCHPITFGMLDQEGRPMVRFNAHTLFTADTLIEAAWLAVVDFIQSHNEKKNQ